MTETKPPPSTPVTDSAGAGRRRQAVEVKGCAPDRPSAEVVEFAASEEGVIEIDVESADAAGSAAGGARQHDAFARGHAPCDRRLFSEQTPGIAVGLCGEVD